jgi:hypothetical protein
VLQDNEHRDLARHHRPDRERHVPGSDEVAVQLRCERGDAVGEHGETDGDGLGASGSDAAGGQVGVRGESAAVVDLGAARVVRERGHGAGVADGEVGVEGGVEGGRSLCFWSPRGNGERGEAEPLQRGRRGARAERGQGQRGNGHSDDDERGQGDGGADTAPAAGRDRRRAMVIARRAGHGARVCFLEVKCWSWYVQWAVEGRRGSKKSVSWKGVLIAGFWRATGG